MASTQPSGLAYNARRSRQYLAELWSRRDFAWFLAVGNFKARNASTTLGLLWWVLNPLLLSLVYFLIFGILFPGVRDLIYLTSGMFVFHFTAQSLSGGANAILQNSKLLVNVRFPRLILPIANLIESLLGFLVSLGVLVVLAFLLRGTLPGPSVLLLVVAIPLQFVFNLGLGSLAGRLAIPFRDINNLLPYLTRVWLYSSPVIWPVSRLDGEGLETFARLAELNPMFAVISVYRSALLGDPFDPSMLVQFAVWSISIGVLGVAAYVKYEGKMVRYL